MWGDKGAAPPRGVRPSPRLTDKRLLYMAVAKKIELTANQLWVLKYILHEVASSEEGANGIYLTPKERVSLGQIRSKL